MRPQCGSIVPSIGRKRIGFLPKRLGFNSRLVHTVLAKVLHRAYRLSTANRLSASAPQLFVTTPEVRLVGAMSHPRSSVGAVRNRLPVPTYFSMNGLNDRVSVPGRDGIFCLLRRGPLRLLHNRWTNRNMKTIYFCLASG